MTTETTVTVTMDTAGQMIRECIAEDQPYMLWGDTGIGKSELHRQVAADLGLKLWSYIPSRKQPTDLSGIPVPDLKKGRAIWLRPDDLPDPATDGAKGHIFFDEINTAVPLMQASMYEAVLDGRVGKFDFSSWTRGAAGNRTKDRAAAQRMPTALRNRLLHMNVMISYEAWKKWAERAGIDPFGVAFLGLRKELLHVSPVSMTDKGLREEDVNSFPTPRSWVRAFRFLNRAPEIRQLLVSGLVGCGPAAELEGFLRIMHQCPTAQQIEADPATAPCPPDSEPAARYAVTGLIVRAVTRQNIGAFFTYAKRLGREFEALVVSSIVNRDDAMKQTKAYVDWSVANQDIML